MEREENRIAMRAARILKSQFGYDGFRPGQCELVSAIMEGRDCVGVMPTGAGKSICYQVPALAFAHLDEDGLLSGENPADDGRAQGESSIELMFQPAMTLSLVVSPLVSLMSDQVMALKGSGIRAAYLNSRLTPLQQEEVLSRARAGAYAIMYVAPERLDDPRFLEFAGASSIPIALVAVDEAHCVSQWGQDFRPSYLRIASFIEALPKRPVVAAFTATATPRVADDVVRLLKLRDPFRVTTGFDRPNLRFGVEQLSEKKKLARIAARALEDPGQSGIVYCSTRKEVERLHEALVAAGVRATRYHAGLAHGEREANQRAFVNDDAPVMVATNAFGMGIDKSNVRYVIHNNMPGSLEEYYQEAGRAGRDGEPSECLLLWNDSDIATCRHFVERDSGNEALSYEEQQCVRASQRRRLAAMANYCMTTDCLRATILRYFGEGGWCGAAPESLTFATPPCQGSSTASGTPSISEPGPGNGTAPALAPEGFPEASAKRDRSCGNCSNCDGDVDAVDVTKTARSVMRCVHELRGRFGKGIVTDVLCGSQSAKLQQYGLTRRKTYGIVDDSPSTVKEIIELLTAGEYLEISEGRYPLVGLGPRAREAATDEFRLYIKRRRKTSASAEAKKAAGARTAAGKAAAAGAGGAERDASASAETARAKAKRDWSEQLVTEEDRALFERLRQLRKRLADEEGLPPYMVFSDASLRAMCVGLPRNEEEFLEVPGVGPAKLKRYGKPFLEAIDSSPS